MRPVLLYDGTCTFCRFAARTILRLDGGRIAALPFDDPAAAALLEPVPASRRTQSIHLAQPSGAVSGSVAFEQALRLLRVPAPRLLSRLYEPVSSRRAVLGRLVPDGPAPRRFP